MEGTGDLLLGAEGLNYPPQEDQELVSQSTNSVLGDIIKEYKLDQLPSSEIIGLTEETENFCQQVNQFQTLQPADILDTPFTTIENPSLITSQDNQIVFELIGGDQAESSPPIVDKKPISEGEEIMASITGFGIHQAKPISGMNDISSGYNIITQPQQPQQIRKPFVKVIEQPAENKLRFRYECEGRSAGSLQGENSKHDFKTYPTIQIVNYTGPAVCVVSLVEHDKPFRTHPHNLVGRDGLCKHGVCSVDITKPDMTYSFQNLGIQCVKKKDAGESLKKRQDIKVDPFKQGFNHSKKGNIDLNQVRLCFQVFLKTPNVPLLPLQPVVSNIIKDRKAHSDLSIVDYSDDKSPVEGDKKILLFCEKVNKDDIEVHFTQFTKSGEEIIAKGDFTSNDVHKQHGISLRTPAYINKDITEPVKCSMFLYKPKEKASSDPVDFWYIPTFKNEPKPINIKQIKRPRAPKINQDDSSGRIAIPTKRGEISPAQLHCAGGNVTISAQEHQTIISNAPVFLTSTVNQRVPTVTPSNNHHLASSPQTNFITNRPSAYEQIALSPNGDPMILRPNDITAAGSIAQNDLFRDEKGYVAAAGNINSYQNLPSTMANEVVQIPNVVTTASNESGMNHLNEFLQTNFGIDNQASSTLPNLSISGDLNMVDMENLSNHLDSNLKIDKNVSSIQRQSSQLHTPDVSLSMDGGSSKKNNK